MAVPVRLDLPFERQQSSTDTCGAAALSMVYRSFGVVCSQEEVWPAITVPGSSRARTYLICADALRRGFAAVTLQARQALALLHSALEHEVRVIVHHRQSLNSRWGHYSVLVGMDDDGVAIHDPLLGPSQRYDQADWLKLWRPGPGNAEVRGNLAVFIAPRTPESQHCQTCGREAPSRRPCSTCGEQIRLQPGIVLGCPDSDCPGRTWDLLFCPRCDAEMNRLE